MQITFECILVLTAIKFTVGELSGSLIFSDFVGIRWANYSSNNVGYLQSLSQSSAYQSHVFGIVIDAGSTGTRIHIYKLSYDFQDRTQVYTLLEETLREVRPGLSSYAARPRDVRAGLYELLSLAQKRVPASLSHLTHVTMRATAGLRLLPETVATQLLDEARYCIQASGFRIDRVDIMDGVEEAVQAWVTVNYLLNRLKSPQRSLGVMDLGGASTQITFVPTDERTLSDVPKDHRHNLTVAGRSVEVYTHSYLGLGLMSARLAVLSSDGGLHESAIVSPCIALTYQGHWTHGGLRYSISGAAPRYNMSRYDECYHKSRRLVREYSPVVAMSEMRLRRFYLFSYFYDRVKDAGIDPDDLPNGQITVSDFRKLAQTVCRAQNSTSSDRKPFLCLDLVYIYALLKDGYCLQPSNSFHLAKQINNIELGWSLGTVFDLLYRTELL